MGNYRLLTTMYSSFVKQIEIVLFNSLIVLLLAFSIPSGLSIIMRIYMKNENSFFMVDIEICWKLQNHVHN